MASKRNRHIKKEYTDTHTHTQSKTGVFTCVCREKRSASCKIAARKCDVVVDVADSDRCDCDSATLRLQLIFPYKVAGK